MAEKDRVSPYFIGQGTGIVKKFDTFADMCDYHRAMPALDRHFCKLYDHPQKRLAEGWAVFDNYENPKVWRKWE